MGTSIERFSMSLIDDIRAAIPSLGSYGLPDELVEYVKDVEFVQDDLVNEIRWGVLHMSVFRRDEEFVGIVYETAPAFSDEVEPPAEWDIRNVRPVQTTVYEVVR